MNETSAAMRGAGAFAFQTGDWRVRHRKLRRRLAQDHEWIEFDGLCSAWEFMDGAANLDDHVFDDPQGPYRGASLRRLDPQTGRWSIWWWDSRRSELDPPVVGDFEDGIGRFETDDTLDGRPIKVRFLWSHITADAARWEQAFSPDDGATWETNWVMLFERIG